MPLQFNPYDEVRRRNEQGPDFNQTVTNPIMQGLQLMLQQRNQQQTLDLARQKEGRESQQFRTEYGHDAPVAPRASFNPETGSVSPMETRRILKPMSIDRSQAQRRILGTPADQVRSTMGLPEGYTPGTKHFDAYAGLVKAGREPNVTEESYTIAGTDQNGNIIQIGNKSGTVRTVPVPGGGPVYPKNEPAMTPEGAGRLNMLKEAVTNMEAIRGKIFDEQGRLNRSLMFTANVPGGGLPFTEGRNIDSIMDDAINAKLRAETGAAATPQEIANVSRRFRISVRDDDQTAMSKYTRFVDWLKGAQNLADPRGFRTGGTTPSAPPPTSGLMWQGRPIKDTPANRAWLAAQQGRPR